MAKNQKRLTNAQLKKRIRDLDKAIKEQEEVRDMLIEQLDVLEGMFKEFSKKKYLNDIRRLKKKYAKK